MLCGSIILLLVHTQNQQLTMWIVPGEHLPCQTERKSLSPVPRLYETASGTGHSPSPVSLHLPQPPAIPSHGRLLGYDNLPRFLKWPPIANSPFFPPPLFLTPSKSEMLGTINLETPAFQILLHSHPSPVGSWFSGQ